MQYNYNSITQKFCCIAAVRTSTSDNTIAIQVFLQLLQVACKFSASCRKLVLQCCIACRGPHKCNTTAIQEKVLYCSCIVVVLHLCGPLYRGRNNRIRQPTTAPSLPRRNSRVLSAWRHSIYSGHWGLDLIARDVDVVSLMYRHQSYAWFAAKSSGFQRTSLNDQRCTSGL